jgi:hypothetical protein
VGEKQKRDHQDAIRKTAILKKVTAQGIVLHRVTSIFRVVLEDFVCFRQKGDVG